MFTNELGGRASEIPPWAKDAFVRWFWVWYGENKSRTFRVRVFIVSLSLRLEQVKPALVMIFGPEPAS